MGLLDELFGTGDERDEGDEWKRGAGESSDETSPEAIVDSGEQEPSGYDALLRRGDSRAAQRLYEVSRRQRARRPRLCRVCYHEFRGRSPDDVRCDACRAAGRPWNRQAKNEWVRYCDERGLYPWGDGWERTPA